MTSHHVVHTELTPYEYHTGDVSRMPIWNEAAKQDSNKGESETDSVVTGHHVVHTELTPYEYHTGDVSRMPIWNEATEPKQDSLVTSHHVVHTELTPYEYHTGDVSPMPIWNKAAEQEKDSLVTSHHVVHTELTPYEYHTGDVSRMPIWNEAVESEKDSIVTAHHVRPEETAYEYHSGDHTMATPTAVPHPVMSHMPVYVEDHEDHHHEPPRAVDSRLLDPDYRFDHLSHAELDHKFDDAHDVTPVEFHEHRVLPAVPSPDRLSYEHGYAHHGFYQN